MTLRGLALLIQMAGARDECPARRLAREHLKRIVLSWTAFLSIPAGLIWAAIWSLKQ